MDQSSQPFVVLEHARSADQLLVMQQITADGVCPFCMEHLFSYHDQPILWGGISWIITPSRWPYAGTRLHLLAISIQHVEHLSDVTPSAAMDLWQGLSWVEQNFTLAGGAIGLRFGDPTLNGGSVRHLHAHIIVADGQQPVRFKMG
ncbi:HIT domain-containing protein [candidate division WWE3 bacterium]|nr:HIT domain-containing protein [candidate division WWE3 bacterium]